MLAHSSATGRSAFSLIVVKSLTHDGLLACRSRILYCDTYTPRAAFMIAESLCMHFLTSFLFHVVPWERGLSDPRIAMPRDHIWLKCACAFSLNEVGSHLVFVERSSVTIGAAKMAYRMPACVIDNGTGWVIREKVDATRDEKPLLLPMIWLVLSLLGIRVPVAVCYDELLEKLLVQQAVYRQ